jgi:anti-sigma-K factor RskA
MYDDDQDALAAEYVLGTLSADERDQATALLAIDAGFAAVVRSWERRLGELNVMVEAVEPPSKVWDKVKTSIAGVERVAPKETLQLPLIEDTIEASVASAFPSFSPETTADAEEEPLASSILPEVSAPAPAPMPKVERVERSATVVDLTQRVKRWRNVSLLTTALAACLAIVIGAELFAPDLIPAQLRMPRLSDTATMRAPAQQAGPLVAMLQQDPGAPAFLLSVDLRTRTLTVHRVAAAREANRSYELWLVSKRFPAPRSLGVVGADEFTQHPIPANYDTDTVNTATYAVSLEPAGGSPSGVPTGPVLFKGNLIQSIPAPNSASRTQ